MEENNYRDFLRVKGIDNESIELNITKLRDLKRFLEQENKTLKNINPNELIAYTEYLVAIDKDSVLDFLRAIINYANYSKEYDLIKIVIDISESYNAIDTLYSRIAEIHGQEIRDDIFHELIIPPLGVDPEKKPQFTKVIMTRVIDMLGEENTIKLLSPCLHGRPPDDIPGDKKKLEELGIDKFLKSKHKDLIKRLQKHRDEGTLEFAQYIDDKVIDYIKKDQMFGFGIREENRIYVKKIPYQTKSFLNAQEDNLKRFYICYCPWVRGAMKENTVDESLRHFCHCSAGWYKLYWDQIFDHPIKAEPVTTALTGEFECKIAIIIPENILKQYIK